jgi:hypothetical protein
MAEWVKSTPYGDYKDFLQNHKFDDQLVYNVNTKKFVVYNKVKNILHAAKWYFGKHIGSKKLSRVAAINKQFNKQISQIKKSVNKIKENLKNNENAENISNNNN